MTALPYDGSTAPPTPAAWLKARLWAHSRPIRLATALTIADVAPVVGFAAGLALAFAGLERSLWAAAPGLVLAALALVARGGLGWLALRVGTDAGRRVKGDVRRGAIAALFRTGPIDRGGLVAAVEGAETLDGYVGRFATARTAAVVSPLLLIAACALASPVSAAILLATLVPFIAGMALAGLAAREESRRQFAALDRLASRYLDRVRALPVLLAFQAETATRETLAKDCDALEARTAKVLRIAFLSSAVMEFFSALSVALVAVYCGFALLGLLPFPAPEPLNLPRALFVLALAPEVYGPLRRLSAAYHERQAAEAAVPGLERALAAPGPRRRASLSRPPEIRFEGVTIRYADGAEAISWFDLAIMPGQIVAITGASGSGKTSLLHLLLGMAPLAEGEVRVDGQALSDSGDLAGAVAWAGQHPFVSPGSLGHNIALARPSATRREVMAAAARAGLSGDLDRMLDERGGGLSGGERRRLGLARALLSDAPLVLLDEPTANLDRAGEAALLPALRTLLAGRTTLIATHSSAVAALAHRVVRL